MIHIRNSIALCLGAMLIPSAALSSVPEAELIPHKPFPHARRVLEPQDSTVACSQRNDYARKCSSEESWSSAQKMKDSIKTRASLTEVKKGLSLPVIPLRKERPSSLFDEYIQRHENHLVNPKQSERFSVLTQACLDDESEIKEAKLHLSKEKTLLQKLEHFIDLKRNNDLQSVSMTLSKKRLSAQLRTDLGTFVTLKNHLEDRVSSDLMDETTLIAAIEIQTIYVSSLKRTLRFLKERQKLHLQEHTLFLREKVQVDSSVEKMNEVKRDAFQKIVGNGSLSKLFDVQEQAVTASFQEVFDTSQSGQKGTDFQQSAPQESLSFVSAAPSLARPCSPESLPSSLPKLSLDLETYTCLQNKLRSLSSSAEWDSLEDRANDNPAQMAQYSPLPSPKRLMSFSRQESDQSDMVCASLYPRSALGLSRLYTSADKVDLSLRERVIVSDPDIPPGSSALSCVSNTEKK